MNGGTFQNDTKYPLKIPNAVPIKILRINANGIGIPYVKKQYPDTNEQQNITGPIEKSIPPVAITNVTPSERNPKKYT